MLFQSCFTVPITYRSAFDGPWLDSSFRFIKIDTLPPWARFPHRLLDRSNPDTSNTRMQPTN